jgi:glyoxylase-like metal-dependent hydrolase (beta-lactamase superfamily II)/GNAT superfamily N-acetyltransferase
VLRIVRVLAPNADVYTLDGTNTWVVGDPPSIVVDPGPEIPSHLDEVAATAGIVAAVLVTHDHPDHAPAAAAFAGRVGAPLYAFRLGGAQHLHDGQEVDAGSVRLRAIHAPGHTSDHMVFLESDAGALFTGDAVLGRGTSFIDPPSGDLAQYLRSLERMRALGARTIYPGHGPIVLDAAARLEEYVRHRAEREEQVLAAIATSPTTVDAIVEGIYAGYPAEVRPLGARSVLAHLLKLQAEGRVARIGRGDDAAWSAVDPRTCERCGRRPALGRTKLCGPCSLAVLQETADERRPAVSVVLEPATDRESLVPLLLEADESEPILRSYLHQGDLYRILADGEAVGAVLLIRSGDTLEVKNVAILEPHRGRGIGAAGIERVAELARAAGVRRLVVGTADTSAEARRFYLRCGFREDGRRAGFFDAYPEAVIEDGVTAHDMVMFSMDI